MLIVALLYRTTASASLVFFILYSSSALMSMYHLDGQEKTEQHTLKMQSIPPHIQQPFSLKPPPKSSKTPMYGSVGPHMDFPNSLLDN